MTEKKFWKVFLVDFGIKTITQFVQGLRGQRIGIAFFFYFCQSIVT